MLWTERVYEVLQPSDSHLEWQNYKNESTKSHAHQEMNERKNHRHTAFDGLLFASTEEKCH